MAVPTASPSTNNYSVLKGIVTFDRDTLGSPRDLGNCPSFKLTPTVTKLAHFTSRQGTKKKDKEIVTEQSVTLEMQLDEITDENLALALMGNNVAGVFGLLSETLIEGTISFTGTNDEGNLVSWEGEVSITPSGSIDLISDDWAVITVSCEVLADASTGEFGTMSVEAQA